MQLDIACEPTLTVQKFHKIFMEIMMWSRSVGVMILTIFITAMFLIYILRYELLSSLNFGQVIDKRTDGLMHMSPPCISTGVLKRRRRSC